MEEYSGFFLVAGFLLFMAPTGIIVSRLIVSHHIAIDDKIKCSGIKFEAIILSTLCVLEMFFLLMKYTTLEKYLFYINLIFMYITMILVYVAVLKLGVETHKLIDAGYVRDDGYAYADISGFPILQAQIF